MIIDFHTHIFPDKIAERSIKSLEELGNIKAFIDGTLDGLKKVNEGEQYYNIGNNAVITKPSQFETVNNFAAQITGKDGIISFGGIHPDIEDYKESLEEIKNLGLLGIKLHPDYQETFVDDPKMVRIIQYASELGLIVLLHAGVDIGLAETVYCTPKRAANMLRQIDCLEVKIVLAHTGGYDMWEDVEEYIVGQNVWLDTSYSLGKIKDEQFVRIVKNHGADRILFGTDSPWGGQKETYEYLKKLDFTEEEFESILYGNAQELLGLQEL